MKTLTKLSLVLMIIVSVFSACNKEKSTENIVAPNGVVVAETLEDLTMNVANSLDVSTSDFFINTISYLEVEEGFIAVLTLYLHSNESESNVIYMSEHYTNQIVYNGEMLAVKASPRNGDKIGEIGEHTVSCGCGLTPAGCTTTNEKITNGKITFDCISINCILGDEGCEPLVD